MSARDWIEKDFYAELGVPPDASSDEVKRSYRKLARELHPDANPGDTKAEARFKAVSEAYGVLSDSEKRKQYDEARRLFGGSGGGGFRPNNFEGFGNSTFDFSDMFANRGGGAAGGAGGIGDILGGLFGKQRGAQQGGARPQRGADVETEIRLDFVEAIRGATVPLRLSSPAACTTCHGSGARPGTSPRTCPTCSGAGLVTRSQGAFAFSEPCRDCRGTGKLIDDPCPECGGEGVSTQTRTLTVRIPSGVTDGQRIRLSGQGEPGRRGAAAGDLYVRVHVTPHPVFGREGDDLTLALPVTFPELTLGATLSVPTLDGRVSVKVAPGTTSGRVLRVRGRGIGRRDGSTGDLLVTLQVTVPSRLEGKAEEALRAYADATEDHDPRAELTRLLNDGHRE
ncbi:molecular chaperone DnaJ [Actinoalloteichus hoggarensis]|uniref:Chaperone protein DnaJ n=1 Tax=Actinoalloteichus hoggarensis TaxID=1470176 RepID=A0A221WC11_9PSEU|nr:molecular chaperone DnaJ [Actinoalloteichus hoggarensis]ASO23029.1 Chaperone protein DnaJ [Actinoalloteichus hoggarensis]MBB5922634.1 molecular chaperone DnaJ [Actinoalloteichus hoggarensis]